MNNTETIINAEKIRNRKMLKVLIPATVIMIALAIAAGIFANKAGNRTAASAKEFIDIVEYEFKYEVYDVKSELDEDDLLKKAFVAKKDDSIAVYFLEFKEKAGSKSFFAGLARKYKGIAEQEGVVGEQEIFENYEYYAATADGKFMYTVRVKNTVLFATVSEKDAQDIKTIVKKLNY